MALIFFSSLQDGLLLFLIFILGSTSSTAISTIYIPKRELPPENTMTYHEPKALADHLPSRFQQHDQQHYLHFQHSQADDNLADGIIEGDGYTDDDGWWDGVEEVDLTHKTPIKLGDGASQFYLAPLSGDQLSDPWSENDHQYLKDCGKDSYCDVGISNQPPKLTIPPPPLPPFMPGLVNMIRRQNLEVFIGVPPESHCSLCRWAEDSNSSLAALAHEPCEYHRDIVYFVVHDYRTYVYVSRGHVCDQVGRKIAIKY